MIKMIKDKFVLFIAWVSGSQRKRDREEIKALLKEVRQNQRIQIAVQRKLNERVMLLQYAVDKLRDTK